MNLHWAGCDETRERVVFHRKGFYRCCALCGVKLPAERRDGKK